MTAKSWSRRKRPPRSEAVHIDRSTGSAGASKAQAIAVRELDSDKLEPGE